MEAGKINIGGIFDRARILKIPHFQRAYVWDEEQWERFLDDMRFASSSPSPYFMGSIILKQQETRSTDKKAGDVRTIIDGQQRLTTIVLFFFMKFPNPMTALVVIGSCTFNSMNVADKVGTT